MDPIINLTELISPEVKFEFVSQGGEIVKAATDASGKKTLHGVASSTTKDLHGDVITLSALQDMERTAVGMTIYLNHSYELPKDVAGTCTRAIIKQKGVDQNGDPNYQLEFDVEVEDENPDAVQTWRYIQKGRKLGLSIGAMIPEGGAKRQKDGSYIIEHVNLLETSLVGIPANPKSWVDYAASALRGMDKAAKTTELGKPTLTLDNGRYKIEGSLEGLELSIGDPDFSATEPDFEYAFSEAVDGKTLITRSKQWPVEADGMAKGLVETLGAWDLADADDRLVAAATVGEDVIAKATVWVETRDGDTITIGEPPAATNDITPDAIKASCPTCGKGRDTKGCDDPYHTKDIEPDVTDAKIRVIEVDTDAPASGDGQGAADSEPDDAGTLSAPPADVTADGEPVILEDLDEAELVQLTFTQLRAAALAAVKALDEVKRQLSEEKSARTKAETERDAAFEAAADIVRRTNEVIEKIANSPLPRKAAIKEAGKQLTSSIESYYGPEMARAFAGEVH